MSREQFTNEKKKIFFCCLVYGLVCEAISLFVIGFNLGFLLGIIVGILTVTINMSVLERAIDIAISGTKLSLAFLLQMGRLLLYVLSCYFCYKVGNISVIAYGIGAIGLTIGAAITYVKEGKNG